MTQVRRADRRKYHYIYKITCSITNRYYIGMHSTDNLKDGYMGSGKRIKYSINKHGIENHKKEIIEFTEDRQSLRKREAELVNRSVIKDDLCMNLKLGGEGGWDHLIGIPHTEKQQSAVIKNLTVFGNNKRRELLKDEKYRKAYIQKLSDSMLGKQVWWIGKKHTPDTIAKMKKSAKGKHCLSKNSQFGTRWIYNPSTQEVKKISKFDILPEGFLYGRKFFGSRA